jgi:hypothetical protein
VDLATAREERIGLSGLLHTLAIAVSLAGVACALTLVYLSMRSVMNVGGFCAEGGAYNIRQHCPQGVPGIMTGSIWGGLILVFAYAVIAARWNVPSLLILAWSALFLSLGWNFFEFAFRASNDDQGLPWGWIVCGVLFAIMGGIPLLIATQTLFGRRTQRLGSIANIGGSVQMAASGLSAFRQLRKSMPDMIKAMQEGMAAWPQAPGAAWTQAPGSVVPPGATGASSPVGTPENLVTVLAKLDELHRSGALSDAEYQVAKSAVLGQHP